MNAISVIIINYNSSEFTINCIKSLMALEQHSVSKEIIVIDNNSSPVDYNQLLDGLKEYQNIILKRSIINTGFGGGNMLGAQYASGDYLLFLNNDVVLNNNAITMAYDFMQEHANVGVCTAQNYDEYGKFVPAFDHNKGLRKLIFGRRFIETFFPKQFPNRKTNHQNPIEVNFINGAFMFFRKKAFEKVGGFDTNIFLYFEEMDICFRLKKNQFSSVLLPEASITHYQGASTGQNILISKEGFISYLYVLKKNYGYCKYKTIQLYLSITFLFKPKKWNLLPIVLKGGNLELSLKQKQILRF